MVLFVMFDLQKSEIAENNAIIPLSEMAEFQ